MNIKKEIKKLDAKYEKDLAKLREKCKHNWVKSIRNDSSKYEGTQWYECTICGDNYGECY